MKSPLKDIATAVGVSAAEVAVGAALVGALLIVIGISWGITIFLRSWRRSSAGGVHQLLPTLAEDVLDSDLGAIYQRTLRLDARLFNAQHPIMGEAAPAAHTIDARMRAGVTGSALGRALRKLLVTIQAGRFACASTKEPYGQKSRAQKNEPPVEEARLRLMGDVLDEALALDATSSRIAPALERLTLKIDRSRRELQQRVARKSVDPIDAPGPRP